MLVTIMMILQYSFDVVFSLFCHSLQFILITTITCSTDLDDFHDTHTRFASRAVLSFVSRLGSASLFVGTRCTWKAVWKVSLVCGSLFTRVDRGLSVNSSVYVNDAGSILLSTVQTKLIENQLSMKLLKSVHTASITGMFPLLEGKDINLVTTVFLVIEDIDIHPKTYMFRKTDLDYPVFAHPTLVLKRDYEKNMKLQDDRFCESTSREV